VHEHQGNKQTNNTANMNVLFDMLSGGKEMAPGGGKGRGRGPKAKRQVQGEWKRDGMLPGRVFTSSSPLVLKKKNNLPAFRSPLCSLILLSKIPKFQFQFSWRVSQKIIPCGCFFVCFDFYSVAF